MTKEPNMTFPIYQLDAFTSNLFGGNPAAVMPLESWLADDKLQSIAAENNLAETAYFIADSGEADFNLRWFTPTKEMDLCGHATLASAHVIFHQLGWEKDEVLFSTLSGILRVSRSSEGLTLDFPSRPPELNEPSQALLASLGIKHYLYAGYARDWLIEVSSEAEVQTMTPDFRALANETQRAVIVTAAGDEVDFVSRFFAPEYGVDEDPVTGSAHCTLVPYWAEKLAKNTLDARQISARGGELLCHIEAGRVFMTGQCVVFLQGQVFL